MTSRVWTRRADPKAQTYALQQPQEGHHDGLQAQVLYTAEKPNIKNACKNACSVFNPRTITLLLGQPGSDTSLLKKVLSFPLEKNVSVEDDITYNNKRQEALTTRLLQIAAECDTHFPALTE